VKGTAESFLKKEPKKESESEKKKEWLKFCSNLRCTMTTDTFPEIPEEAGNEAAAAPEDVLGEPRSVATLSSPWQYDDSVRQCTGCRVEFNPLNRRHHCRLCGRIFCHDCSHQRALIPPSRIVLVPTAGKKASTKQHTEQMEGISFSPDPDPDRMLTYVSPPASGREEERLLYGKGLEERFKLAREPIRVCAPCHEELQPLQAELRSHNSHAVRFNHIDPTDNRRLFNSPLAFTLGHEIRKAAYTLNNLLPLPKRMGAIVSGDSFTVGHDSEMQHCKETCSAISPNASNLDGVRIPARLLEQAKGVAVMTVLKTGFGIAGAEFGTGLVVARLPSINGTSYPRWSAPAAIGTAGIAWGALVGAQVSDHIFLLMTDAAVELLYSNGASVQLGADVGVAVGPLGRAVEGDWAVASNQQAAPIYTYSMSKGLYAGISLDGKVIFSRPDVNEKFYGCSVTAKDILAGAVPTPPAAQPLYEALQRCHVYVSGHVGVGGGPVLRRSQPPRGDESAVLAGEYGEMLSPREGGPSFFAQQQPVQPPAAPQPVLPPAAGDGHSYSAATGTIVSDMPPAP
jgi:lipid-binding SYLF domain-containing protein